VDEVSITIPASPQYVGVVRLVAAGLAARQGFSLDDSEDLKIAVDELSAYVTGAHGRRGFLEVVFSLDDECISFRGYGRLEEPKDVRTNLTELSRMILETVAESASLERVGDTPTFHASKTRA
jgi:anti-sigma regulatory factor (Ser/Thr protein kinase)